MCPGDSLQVFGFCGGLGSKIEMPPGSIYVARAPACNCGGALELRPHTWWQSRWIYVYCEMSEARVADEHERVAQQDAYIRLQVLQPSAFCDSLNQLPETAFTEQLEVVFVRHTTQPRARAAPDNLLAAA